MKIIPRETIDAEALDINHVYHEHTRDANEFERNYSTVDSGQATTNVFGGRVPSSPEELMDWVQDYSNQTGFVGRMYGYNVKPQKPDHRIAMGILLFVFACLLMGFLGSLMQY